MRRNVRMLVAFIMVLRIATVSGATSLVDTFDKKFRTLGFPEAVIVVRLRVESALPRDSRPSGTEGIGAALRVHDLLNQLLLANDWSPLDPWLSGTIDGGRIRLETKEGMDLRLQDTLRLRVFLDQCDPSLVKYRGEHVDDFFRKKVIERAEACMTWEHRLQGPGYPY